LKSLPGWIWRHRGRLPGLPVRPGGLTDGLDLRRPNGSMQLQAGRRHTRLQSVPGRPLRFLH
jgi:hypothetical protein